MTKGQKKKITVKTIPGEAVFVASVDILNHIAETYLYMASSAETKEDAQSWQSVSDQINEWIKRTYHSAESSYEDQDEEW
jgi:alcohol dehydrogenase YqhD (iron-dependent ADH family)